jgi:hypothetical protein
MSEQPQLHSSIVAMISLASGIASRHPDMGLCQLDRLRSAGVPEHQINTVIEIARHIRDEASQKVDAAFNEKAAIVEETVANNETADCCNSKPSIVEESSCCNTTDPAPAVEEGCGCTQTPSGQNCC